MHKKRYEPLPVNENLRKFSVEMRKNPTDEERKVWYGYLRHLKPNFHRQRIIGDYIVDFYSPKLNLVIEIDGSQHNLPENQEYDETRTKYIESLGFTVLRLKNEDVNYDFSYVVFKIREACNEKSKLLGIEFVDKTLNW